MSISCIKLIYVTAPTKVENFMIVKHEFFISFAFMGENYFGFAV